MTGIYYSDLFVINGCGCLVMGFGKSRTCRNYTGEGTVEVGVDSIRLERAGDKLFGYADPTMGMLPFSKENAECAEIAFLVRMLDEKETEDLKCNSIIEIEETEYVKTCDFNITYGVSNEDERRKEFSSLIEDLNLKCILVPWCVDMETKGKIIKDFIKG